MSAHNSLPPVGALPDRPDRDQLRRQANELHRAAAVGDLLIEAGALEINAEFRTLTEPQGSTALHCAAVEALLVPVTEQAT